MQGKTIPSSALVLAFGLFSIGREAKSQTPTPGRQDETEPVPVILLNHTTGNFFVLASDVSFRVGKILRGPSWFEVDRLEESETLPRVVEVASKPQGLARGIYFSAVRIDVETGSGNDHILIPVVLRVGEEFENRFGLDPDIQRRIPSGLVRLELADENLEVRANLTPGGHFIIEIVDKTKELRDLETIRREILPSAAAQTYPVVFPWMCLEYPCGRKTEDDIKDVEPNVDAVNAVSYERYSMSGGTWRVLSGVGDPGDWATSENLKTWPMVVGGYQPTEAQIQAMWTARETVAQNMISAATSRGYEGFCVDVEGHAQGNSKNLFIGLVTHLAHRLHDNGFKLMVAHATWSTIAPIEDLSASPVDYVATMDPYTSAWKTYIPKIYGAIDGSRLVWGFTWDQVAGTTQETMWQWMASSGYNDSVAGAAAWRTPLASAPNGLNYYDGFRRYYPTADGGADCLASVSPERWKGEYFDNKGLAGSPVLVRDDGDGFLDFNWGSSGPSLDCGVSVDVFSARWTRTVAFSAGTYRFTAFVDDGVRLYVGSSLLIDAWKDQVATYTAEVDLPSGGQTIRMEYYENLGGAAAQLSWEKVGDVPPPGDSVLIDDGDPGFELLETATGRPEWWHPETGVGYGDDMVWTLNTYSRQDNYARWKPVLSSAGDYRVEAHIPSNHATTQNARYSIHANGVVHSKTVNQNTYSDQWVELGTYRFRAANDGSEFVELGDVTGETSISRKVGFDAIRFTTVEPSPSPCQKSVPAEHWKGEYFGTIDLSGDAVMVRDDGDGFLDFDWGSGTPSADCGVPADQFSARWTRRVSMPAGTHRFTVTSDDGFRLYVDGSLKLEKWFDQAPTTYLVDVSLAAGEHTIKVEYYESGGGATAKLSWQLVATEAMLIDDGDPGFELLETATGRPEWWHPETGVGYDDDMVWTLNTYSRQDNYARWKPVLSSAGDYRVEAHIPSNHATTTSARYYIHANGVVHSKTVNQNIYSDQWVELGTYRFSAANDGSEFVELGDVTGETSISRKVGFDAIRFTPAAEPPPPPDSGDWAFPVGSAESGAGWRVTLGLGQSWTASSGQQYNGHLAEDWARTSGATLGQPVYAAASGQVLTVLQNCGNYVDVVIIQHQVDGISEPVYSFYGHLEADGYVKVGDQVTRRQQIGVLGDPVTFGPHLHFEIKNHTALVNPPFSTCSNTSKGIYISAGYSGKKNDYSGGDYYDPTDGVSGNLYYHPTRFIQERLAATAAFVSLAPAMGPPLFPTAKDGLPRCEHEP